MAYQPSIEFIFDPTSPNNGQILAQIQETIPPVIGTINIYYSVEGPLNNIKSIDFNTPDAVLTAPDTIVQMPNVSVPIDSFGNFLEGEYVFYF